MKKNFHDIRVAVDIEGGYVDIASKLMKQDGPDIGSVIVTCEGLPELLRVLQQAIKKLNKKI